MFYLDPTYMLFALPAMILVIYAQYKVRNTYMKYSRVRSQSGLTGAEAARVLIPANDLTIRTEVVRGNLTDHYDPRKKIMRISEGTASNPSVASISIVAHELGHAMQDKSNYPLLRLRSGIVPIVNISSWLGYILFLLGVVLRAMGMVWLGVILFSAGVVFAVLTLPVELDASKRALAMLRTNGLVTAQETGGVRAVLSAASFTYVAALAQTVSQLLYFVFVAVGMGGSRRRR
jgi:Zn-dependent membrane protease YugP